MAFVKELVSETDKELYQSFQMYDYITIRLVD